MSRALLITVRLHDGRYHGVPEWPPSPARLFQALVAGVGLSGPLGQVTCEALWWLEKREPPVIAAPAKVDGQIMTAYVPNNDLDAKGGDQRRIAEIRTAKVFRPRIVEAGVPWMYAWVFDDGEESIHQADVICALSDRLYQFGRGVDMAWAWGEVIDDDRLEARLSHFSGQVWRPSRGGTGNPLTCPMPGSLESLIRRNSANSQRFSTETRGMTNRQLFHQPPKPRFAQVPYESPPSRYIYELRELSRAALFHVWPTARVSALVVAVRDGAVERLRAALPDRSAEIERVLVGRKVDGSDNGPISLRVRIVPLPSIGHPHADHGIRRVLVEVPAGCPLRADDVDWAFSGLELVDRETGEVLGLVLTPTGDPSMLRHYGAEQGARHIVWRSITPLALPSLARPRSAHRARPTKEPKRGSERAAELSRVAGAVSRALRHAGVRTRAEVTRLQREPFQDKGQRAEAFSAGSRFERERLWHVEVIFARPVSGPLVIGDGRFLGLGLMAPVQRTEGVHAFLVEDGLAAKVEPTEVTRALRRAVMTRVQGVLGARKSLPVFFTGHQRDGSPARTERKPHLTFAWDPERARLLIIAPHVIGQRSATGPEIRHLRNLETALVAFRELRAGSAGCLTLRPVSIDFELDHLFAASRTWESVTTYEVTRHAKRMTAAEALCCDIRKECRRRGLPEPIVTAREPRGVPGVGLVGGAYLRFEVAVKGPIALGKNRHFGGGLFKRK